MVYKLRYRLNDNRVFSGKLLAVIVLNGQNTTLKMVAFGFVRFINLRYFKGF